MSTLVVAPAGPGARVLGGVLVVGVAAGTGAALVHQPGDVVLALSAAALLGAMTVRVEWALLAYVAAEPFGDALESASRVSIKAVGGLLFAAWLLRLGTRVRPVALRHGATYAAGAVALVLFAATVFHPNGHAGLVVVGRYLSYLAVLVVLVDTLRTAIRPRTVVAVFVWSSTAAAAVGFVGYLGDRYGRASGPLSDPNDFAFFLVCALPLALALWRAGSTGWRHLYFPAAALLLLGTLATYSRGAILGAAAALLYVALTGRLRLRVVLVGAAVAGVLVGTVLLAAPGLVGSSIEAKQHVGRQNVDDRLTAWSMAGNMLADHPVLGLGPAGFATYWDAYVGGRATDPVHLDVAHDTWLEVGSETGLLGLAAFLALIGAGAAGAVRAARSGPEPTLAAGVCASFAAVVVAASFLSEQFFLPLWLLVALGAALDRPAAAAHPPSPRPIEAVA
jgi:O-antigen ligase